MQLFAKEVERPYEAIQRLRRELWDKTKVNYPIYNLSKIIKYFRNPFPIDPESDFMVNIALNYLSKEFQKTYQELIKSLSEEEYSLVITALNSLSGGINGAPYVGVKRFRPYDNAKLSELLFLLQKDD